jgi:hypothetical protein
VDEKVINIEVLANGISNDLAAMRVKAYEGMLQMVMHTSDVVVVLH